MLLLLGTAPMVRWFDRVFEVVPWELLGVVYLGMPFLLAWVWRERPPALYSRRHELVMELGDAPEHRWIAVLAMVVGLTFCLVSPLLTVVAWTAASLYTSRGRDGLVRPVVLVTAGLALLGLTWTSGIVRGPGTGT